MAKARGTTAVHLDCFGHRCDAHRSTCLVNTDHGLTGRCEDEHMCNDHSSCTASTSHEHGHHHECCCKSQICINNLKLAVASRPHLTCFGHQCDSDNSACLVNREHEFTGRCEATEHCQHHSECTASLEHVHGHNHECCCTDQQCVDNFSKGAMVITKRMPAESHIKNMTNVLLSVISKNVAIPYCKLNQEGHHLVGECIEERQCHDHHRKICTNAHDMHGHEGCCCQTETCISTVTGVSTTHSNATSGNNGIYIKDLACSGVTCGINEVCKIKQSQGGVGSASCMSIIQCATEKVQEAQHPDQPQSLCCATAACVSTALQNIAGGAPAMTKTTAGLPSAPVTDAPAVMKTTVGQTSAPATDAPAVMKTTVGQPPAPVTDAPAVMKTTVGQPPAPVTDAPAVMKTTVGQPPAPATDAPAVMKTTVGQPPAPVTDAPAVMKTTVGQPPAPATDAPAVMKTTVGQPPAPATDAPAMMKTTVGQPPAPVTDAPAVMKTTVGQPPAPATDAPAVMKTTVGQPPAPVTDAPAVMKTTVGQPPAPVTGCPPFSLSCPSSCSTVDVNLCPFCDRSSIGCRDIKPSTTIAPVVTTTPKVCADADPDNCARMQGALCPTSDPNLHHMAVVTCPKTCNLCDEFLLV
ncbi:mucin-19-like [Ylistrum balloti]|uniref:mucin-19-like n=1 Tax=Ylistrum balloti TaxID=509963 RepID=UPI002905AF1A|nr:mucin-19-like [Ylistrum balloti]